jgi:glycerophosphoryl diester phosphodiesterase
MESMEAIKMKRICSAVLLSVVAVAVARGETQQPKQVRLLCHRTANKDLPENTLESLEQAALLGCDVVELDVRRTLDGKLVLNHDGVLERLTDGVGETEKSYYDDLRLRDAGSWMGDRFTGLRITLFEDALRLARDQNIRLILDIKAKGIGPDVLAMLRREGMLEHVQFNGEWDDIKQLYPGATTAGDGTAWVQPGVTSEQVAALHGQGKAVVANFSDNQHEMDLAAMKAAVAAGVDGINVDYPRLGADAVGRPVEGRLNALAMKAETGDSHSRALAILELSRYRGFPLDSEFAHWLLDGDDNVSRAAAIALVTSRPQPSVAVFAAALRSDHADARANAAWALGELGTPASALLPLLEDKDPLVLQQTLLALGRAPGEVSSKALLPLLTNADPGVRGAAALALARHQPALALQVIPVQLRQEIKTAAVAHDDYVRRGQPKLTQSEIDTIVGYFRCQIKMVQAISSLRGTGAMLALEEQAFHYSKDFSQMNGPVAAFQLWDRIGADASPALQALGSEDAIVADRAEWMLVQGGPAVLPDVRKAISSGNAEVRERAIRIVAWQGDTQSLKILREMQQTDSKDAALIAWAIEKINSLHPKL